MKFTFPRGSTARIIFYSQDFAKSKSCQITQQLTPILSGNGISNHANLVNLKLAVKFSLENFSMNPFRQREDYKELYQIRFGRYKDTSCPIQILIYRS